MDQGFFLGFVYLLLGAVCGGSFGLPSKYAPQDMPWENLWGPFFVLVTVMMPFGLGPLLVKDFFAIFGHVGPAGLLMPLIFGFLWGAGSMTLGMSFALIALAMALLHNGAIYLFNLGFPRLGDLGVSVGYASFMSFAIIVGNFHGFRTGEWKGASRQSVAWVLMGILVLILGVSILAAGNALTPK